MSEEQYPRAIGDGDAERVRRLVAGEPGLLDARTALPGEGVTWEGLDGDHARVTLTIDGEAIPLTLRTDE